MDSPFFATPVARQGPTSRILRRRSEKVAQQQQELHSKPSDESMFQVPDRNVSFAVPVTPRNRHFASALGASMMTFNAGADQTLAWEATRYFGRNMTTMSEMNDVTQTMKIGDAYPLLQSTENLFADFLSTISVESFGLDALDQVAELEELVASHIADLKSKKGSYKIVENLIDNFSQEKNTWRVIGRLYHDRLSNNGDEEAMDTDADNAVSALVLRTSEKKMVERLFKRESQLRQAQAVVDWLEQNARDEIEESIHLEYFTDAIVAWENTLAVLNNTSRPTNRSMVTSMDPDAPHRQKLPLHDQDAQDESRLCRSLFALIRSGQLDKAQQLCIKVGEPWRAATLEGWKLFHDPNYERDMGGEKLPVEGNRNRDIWKSGVWKMTQDELIPPFERAIYSAFCGNVQQLLSVSKSWEDYLWAYAKVMVDVCVETEIRELSPKTFVSLPKEFWDNKKSLDEIFCAIAAATDLRIKDEQNIPYHIVQRCLITKKFQELFEKMDAWIEEDDYKNDPHLLRFLSHVVLVIRKLESQPELMSSENGTGVLKAYAYYLMQTNRAEQFECYKINEKPEEILTFQLSWYISRLPLADQVTMYAEFLETVIAESDRRMALTLAIESDLPIAEIKSRVVKNIFNLELDDGDESAAQEEEFDRRKIDSLNWLLYDKHQRSEAILMSNALTRSFVASGKYELAKDCWSILPEDSAQIVSVLSREDNDGVVTPSDVNTINEYLCWKAYFRAKDSFSDWFDHFHRERPKAPTIPQNPTFTEKVAHEQRTKQYHRDLERWQASQSLQAGEACQNLMEVITFSGGWLVDKAEERDKDDQRERETDYLRRLCIPELILLLHSVLHSTEQFDKAIALADVVASEQYSLYEVYHEENMREFLSKLRESSLKAMETGNRDALGWALDEK